MVSLIMTNQINNQRHLSRMRYDEIWDNLAGC